MTETFGTSETVTFWVCACLAVLSAAGMVMVRKAVHSALLLASVMLNLAVLYLALKAPFLGMVQVIVYTGAVMMLFLFVLMLVGVDTFEPHAPGMRWTRWAGLIAGLGMGTLLVTAIGRATITLPSAATVAAAANPADEPGNVVGLAREIFVRYVFAFEVTSALLITAGLGAMVLAHRERLTKRPTQRELAQARIHDMAVGRHPGMTPPPGVFARVNGIDVPALLPDGTAAPSSVSTTLTMRPGAVSHEEVIDDAHEVDIVPSAAQLRSGAPTVTRPAVERAEESETPS